MAEPLIEAKSNLTPESFLELLRERRLAKREQSEAGTLIARVGKKMKELGVNRTAFEIFEKLCDLETDEAIVVLKSVVRYGTWAEKPYATQAELFPAMAVEKPKEAARTEFTEFQIEDAGYKAGYSGEPIDNNPHAPGEADDASYAIWRKGWHNGQEARVHKAFGGETPNTSASPGKRGKPPKRKSAEGNAGEPTKH